MQGRTVRIFLVDGSRAGLVTAEIMNWTGHVLLMPRSRLAEALNRPEASRTGVYLLIGDDPENPARSMLYIGESDVVRKRIKSHAEDEKKDFWTYACVVTSKDRNLTKAHVRYLEGRLIERAKEADRATLANGTEPEIKGLLPEADTSDMEYFLSQIEVVLPVIGIDILRPKPHQAVSRSTEMTAELEKQSDTIELILSVKKHGYEAHALERDGELTVLEGSTALAEPKHATNNYAPLREQLKESGVLKLKEGAPEFLVFCEDFTFKSPSAAASVVNGRNSNGRTDWTIKKTGKTLKEHQDAQLALVVDDPGE